MKQLKHKLELCKCISHLNVYKRLRNKHLSNANYVEKTRSLSGKRWLETVIRGSYT